MRRCILHLVLLSAAKAAKLRPWLGSDLLMIEQDTFPVARSRHGFASTDEGKIYIFGGFGQKGNLDLLSIASNCTCAPCLNNSRELSPVFKSIVLIARYKNYPYFNM